MAIKKDPTDMKADGRRGPKPSGVPRNEIVKKAAKTHRDALLQKGKVELKTFVSPETKNQLAALKSRFNVTTVGEVIDAMSQHFSQLDT